MLSCLFRIRCASAIELAPQYGRYGYRKIAELLRATAGWVVNDKRVERIWRREGLKVPAKQPKRGRLRLTDGSCIRLPAPVVIVPALAAWPSAPPRSAVARAKAEQGDAAAFRLMQQQAMVVGQRRVELRIRMAELEDGGRLGHHHLGMYPK